MRKATVRQVRHDFGEVLKWVEQGDEVTVVKRGRPVARICPLSVETPKNFRMPDFAGRARAVFGKRRTHVSDQLIKERADARW